jgi:hypothetical protein
VEFLDLLLGSL